MKITFLGGVEEVTGSKYLIEHEDVKILVDCGLFQGQISQRNWDIFPVDPKTINAIVLTHAHLDHTGYIPLLVKKGFSGKIYCSPATFALSEIVLLDSGALQEQHVRNSIKYHPDREPAVALYTVDDVKNSFKYFQPIDYDKDVTVGSSLKIMLVSSYHILGSSFVIISDGKQKITFSGDLGRPHQLIMKSPPHLKQTDFLVLESTYGDRLHEENDPIQELGEVINNAFKKGGVLIIPAFAIERTQEILYSLYQLKQKNAIPEIPIFLDSPMGIKVTDAFCKFTNEHTLPPELCQEVFRVATLTPSPEESKHLDNLKKPAIIIAGSGMADGGRVMYHLQHYISDAKNTIVFVGYQASGTVGRYLVNGEEKVKIYGIWYNVHAAIKTINSFSAHADYNEIIEWLSYFEHAPKKVFLTHGELESSRSLQKKIEERFGWTVVIPTYSESFDLD